MQEDRAPSSGNSTRSDSSACVDDTLGQVGAVKVKEEPVDSDEDAQIQEMESGEQAAFMQQVIGKDLAPGFVIKVIIWIWNALPVLVNGYYFLSVYISEWFDFSV